MCLAGEEQHDALISRAYRVGIHFSIAGVSSDMIELSRDSDGRDGPRYSKR